MTYEQWEVHRNHGVPVHVHRVSELVSLGWRGEDETCLNRVPVLCDGSEKRRLFVWFNGTRAGVLGATPPSYITGVDYGKHAARNCKGTTSYKRLKVIVSRKEQYIIA